MKTINHSEAVKDIQRVLGHYKGCKGPLVVAIGGLHGNEPAGILALKNVTERLANYSNFRGEFLALSGNLQALRKQLRYIEVDLNRIWTPDDVMDSASSCVEKIELQDIVRAANEVLMHHPEDEPVIFLDLHTTSSQSLPFAITQNTPTHIGIASHFKVPTILGMDVLEGTLMKYVDHLGHIAVGFEGGQHQSQTSVNNLQSALMVLLTTLGCIQEADFPEITMYRENLAAAINDLPHFLEIIYHHKISAEDQFVMKPGYSNFQRVEKNELLAHDRRGEIYAQDTSLLVLPLYQGQGNDGFFLAKKLHLSDSQNIETRKEMYGI